MIKYYLKSEKFNKKSYLLFSILATLAWGVNYWSSIVSIYGVLILHYKKFKFKNLRYLSYFLLVFITLGFLPNMFGNEIFIDYFRIGGELDKFSISFLSLTLRKSFISDEAYNKISMKNKMYEKVRRENIILKSKGFAVKTGGF